MPYCPMIDKWSMEIHHHLVINIIDASWTRTKPLIFKLGQKPRFWKSDKTVDFQMEQITIDL